MNDGTVYDENYYLYGKRSGKSLYDNYRWMPDRTLPMCQAIVNHCGIERNESILDFGCARGYTVKALRMLGYNASGVDISEWAINNADEEAKPYLRWCENDLPLIRNAFDWIIAKDVLEHIEHIDHKIRHLMEIAGKGLFVVVPLTRHDWGRYIIDEYEQDVTHCQRWPLGTWVDMFLAPGWRVEAAYRMPGVKDNYAQHATGNGFITARRVA